MIMPSGESRFMELAETMNVYLPIAEASINIFELLAVGAGVGVLSGIFGVGGGFLLTPFLIFLGVPPRLPSRHLRINFSAHQYLECWRIGDAAMSISKWALFW